MRRCGAHSGSSAEAAQPWSCCALISALYYARRIAQPLVALSGMAAALGRGEHIPARHLNLREAQATADQIRGAGAALEQRAHEVDE